MFVIYALYFKTMAISRFIRDIHKITFMLNKKAKQYMNRILN